MAVLPEPPVMVVGRTAEIPGRPLELTPRQRKTDHRDPMQYGKGDEVRRWGIAGFRGALQRIEALTAHEYVHAGITVGRKLIGALISAMQAR